jgi:hypothetical protein
MIILISEIRFFDILIALCIYGFHLINFFVPQICWKICQPKSLSTKIRKLPNVTQRPNTIWASTGKMGTWRDEKLCLNIAKSTP